LRSSSLFIFLQPSTIISLFCLNILIDTLFSNTLSLYYQLMLETKFHVHRRLKTKL
jgi:predicted transcriptional regulator YheO